MFSTRISLGCCALLAGLVLPAALSAQDFRALLRLDDIRGNSNLAGFEGQIECFAWSQSLGNGDAAAPPRFNVSKGLDSSSPLLYRDSARGRTFSQATLSIVYPSGGGQLRTLCTIMLRDVRITAVNTSFDEELGPSDNLVLSFASATWTCFGDNGRPLSTSWTFSKTR